MGSFKTKKDWLTTQCEDLFGDLGTPARTLLIALAGVYTALLMFGGRWCMVAVVLVVGIGLGFFIDARGRAKLPGAPDRALTRLEWWVLAPATIAAVAAGIVTYVGFTLVPESLKGADKEIAKALAAAITAFLSAAFVESIGDRDNTTLAARIKRTFHEAYEGRLEPGSKAEIALYDTSIGWGWSDRRKRIAKLAAALKEPQQADPPKENKP